MKHIKKRIIIISLCLAMILGSSLNVFASSVDYSQYLKAGQNNSWLRFDGNSLSISSSSGVGLVVNYLGQNLSELLYNIYTRLATTNSKLDSILSSINNHSSYNYTSILNSISTNVDSIKTNTGWLHTISTGIGLTNTLLDSQTGIGAYTSSTAQATQGLRSDLANVPSNLHTLLDFYNSKFLSTYSVNYIKRQYQATSSGSPSLYNVNVGKFAALYPQMDDDLISPYINLWNSGSIYDSLYLMNHNIVSAFSWIYSLGTYYNLRLGSNDSSVSYSPTFSLADMISHLNNNLVGNLNNLSFIFADSDTISHKLSNKPQSDSVLTNFTGSGSSSASVSDFGGASDSVGAVKNGLNTGTDISNILGVFNISDGYAFFSQSVADDINGTNTANTNSRIFKSNSHSDYSTPLLDEKMRALYSVMGVVNDQ